jgi:hypothetical protein
MYIDRDMANHSSVMGQPNVLVLKIDTFICGAVLCLWARRFIVNYEGTFDVDFDIARIWRSAVQFCATTITFFTSNFSGKTPRQRKHDLLDSFACFKMLVILQSGRSLQ